MSTRKVDYVGVVEMDDRRFYIWFPDVPGALVSADHVSEIATEATRSLYTRLKWLEQHDEPIPPARPLTEVLDDPAVKLAMAESVDFTISVSVSILTETTSVVASGPDWQRDYEYDRVLN